MLRPNLLLFFFFNDTATTEIYTLSLHDALPISFRPPSTTLWSPSLTPTAARSAGRRLARSALRARAKARPTPRRRQPSRSEEHTSELQSRLHLVCRLLLEKKKKNKSWFSRKQVA